MKYQFKRIPKPYQIRALRQALTQTATAVIFDPGLGKTKVGVDFAAIKYLTEGLKRVLIICPLSAMGVWEDEWNLDCPDEIDYLITPLVGDMKKRVKKLREVAPLDVPQVVILSFDTVKNSEITELLLRYYNDILIIDELHHCKSYTSGKTKSTARIARMQKYRIGLTGTLIPKNPLDIISQYDVLDPTIFGNNWWKASRRYADFHPDFKTKPIRWHNMDELQAKTLSIATRAKDTDCGNLTELTVQDIPVYLGDKTKKLYKQMADEMIAEMDDEDIVDAKMAAVKAMKLHQISGGFLQQTKIIGFEGEKAIKETKVYTIGEQEKMAAFKDLLLEQLELGSKVIVACAFRVEIAAITAWLNTQKIDFRVVKGGVTGEERTQIKRDFQSDPNCKVIIFQVSAATSMTLTAGDVGILYSCTYKWDDYFQWLKRLHRVGQTKPVRIYRLVCKGTIDRKILDVIGQKQDFTDVLIDKQSYKNFLTPGF